MRSQKFSVVATGLIGYATSQVVGMDSQGIADSLLKDGECNGAQGSECALNALQHQSLRVAAELDMESSEGAALVEAAREQYSSRFEHLAGYDATQNETLQILGARNGIPPPRNAFQYNGISWPNMTVKADEGGETHIFAIGDWGGMDGGLIPPDNFARMITYEGGHLPGPHVFPRSRLMCDQDSLNSCFTKDKKECKRMCGFAAGVDDKAQQRVADVMLERAAKLDPQFVLNVGDNFYWGGIAKSCGHPMNQIHQATRHQFVNIFERVYKGPGINGKPWLSVLGNHDWGGRMFTAGWDQQIAYTWASDRWVMPAAYWHQRVNFPGYTADIYLVDTNHNDAHAPKKDKQHNICGKLFNVEGASCAAANGPPSVEGCAGWFQNLWEEEQAWLEKKLANSDADWQIAVTHFPCDESPSFWRGLHSRHGLDLLVTGHRHVQQLYKAYRGPLGGLTCFVTGGGGGITSEESVLPGTPSHGWPHVGTQYGFFDMAISKESIKVESIDYMGKVVDSVTVHPTASR